MGRRTWLCKACDPVPREIGTRHYLPPKNRCNEIPGTRNKNLDSRKSRKNGKYARHATTRAKKAVSRDRQSWAFNDSKRANILNPNLFSSLRKIPLPSFAICSCVEIKNVEAEARRFAYRAKEKLKSTEKEKRSHMCRRVFPSLSLSRTRAKFRRNF